MIRCDNCGWYNNDGLTTCEKCGEPLNSSAPVSQPAAPAPQPAAPVSEPKAKLSKTVRLGEPVHVPEPQPEVESKPVKANLRATVMDAGAAIKAAQEEIPDKCPKCHYPLSGENETCPNCGAPLRGRTRKDAVSSSKEYMPANDNAKRFNATVRDFSGVVPVSETPGETYRLVPIDGSSRAIQLQLNGIVLIGGVQYRFTK